ncbi:hypothetical protein [Vagococcus fluvialis]|uniref:glycosyltransferase family A protein n=1 Tax=Vagococcus fluvialis TaxID=2738 RepID=UPI003B5B39E6
MNQSLEVLVATMNCKSCEKLYKKMNLKTDAIIINQTDKIYYEEKIISENKVKCYSFNEKGIGLSRNSALMRSKADICVMADDDMVYVDNYNEIILNGYKKHPDADMLVFNVRIHENGNTRHTVKENKRVHWYNSLRYGTVTFTFKRENILKKNIFFSLLFGGGAKYGSGEDSLFITEVLTKKKKIYSVTDIIADVYNEGSTWFKGYNEKFFKDKGALFYSISNRFAKIYCLQFLVRHRRKLTIEISFREAFQHMLNGIKELKGEK